MSNSSWTDYRNLEENEKQNQQLAEVRAKLARLETIEVARATREARELAHTNCIFRAEQELDRLGPFIETRPQHVFTVISALQETLKQEQVGPDCFDTFAEKDRAKNLFRNLALCMEKCVKKMDESQRADAQLAVKYLLEADQLTGVIDLKTLDADVTSLRQKLESITVPLWYSLMPLAFVVAFVCLVLWGCAPMFHLDNKELEEARVPQMKFGLPSFIIGVFLLCCRPASVKERNQVRELLWKRKEAYSGLQNKIGLKASVFEKTLKPGKEALSLEECVDLKNGREALVEKVLGEAIG